MSLYGTMRTGVSGMNAQSNRLSTVADNIANANTTGYKRASTEFSSMILPSTNGAYNSGGVTTDVRYSISKQGSLSYTTSSTDLAINGNGFFIVQGKDGLESLTRSGGFVKDDSGNLLNSAGYQLMGYQYSSDADPTIVVNGFNGLVPVNLGDGELSAAPSTEGTMNVNVPSNEAVGYSKTTSLTTFDSQGNTRLLDYTYTKTGDNEWTLDVSYKGASIMNQAFNPSSASTVTGHLNSAAAVGATYAQNVTAYDDSGTARTLTYEYKNTGPYAWTVDVKEGATSLLSAPQALTFDSAGKLVTPTSQSINVPLKTTAGPPAVKLGPLSVDLAHLTQTAAASAATGIVNGNAKTSGAPVTLSFDANGKLFNPKSVETSAQIIDGATLNPLDIDISGTSQLASGFAVAKGAIDGNAASGVKGYQIDSEGVVYIEYQNGELDPRFRVALATVQSPDKLSPQSGNVYKQGNDSGVIVMGYAGSAGFGAIQSGALEDSNVDIADELTAMIESQRNYTANSKVFQTGSELLDVLVNLKR